MTDGKGMKETLALRPMLFLEIHGNKLLQFGSNSQKVVELLTAATYETYEILDHRNRTEPQIRLLSPQRAPFMTNVMTLVIPKEKASEILTTPGIVVV